MDLSNIKWAVTGGIAALLIVSGIFYFMGFKPEDVRAVVSATTGTRDVIVAGSGAKMIRQDASQRGTLVISRGPEGQSVSVACSEPPPDVSATVVASLTSSLSALARGAERDASVAQSVAADVRTATETIFQRSQGIQLLRDTMFRLCEAYLNGTMEPASFNTVLLRLIATANFIIPFEQCVSIARTVANIPGGLGGGDLLSQCFARATTLVETELMSEDLVRKNRELEETVRLRNEQDQEILQGFLSSGSIFEAQNHEMLSRLERERVRAIEVLRARTYSESRRRQPP